MPSIVSMNKLTPDTLFLFIGEFCQKVLQMKFVAEIRVCLLYSSPISFVNRTPPGVVAALLVTLYSTAWVASEKSTGINYGCKSIPKKKLICKSIPKKKFINHTGIQLPVEALGKFGKFGFHRSA
ncbi:hypothetical protein LOK49_LG12G00465 [Camellia lanceoleosa]|uniref:Uncharacterized protein n=1 Tax=Camellia lanceoleosa TaxID=1840588 RepID=A0ACC0FY01_9ERIC|nr:hypothetical protein LOK49_LG12G00465 [Camellia lanceoleosa]